MAVGGRGRYLLRDPSYAHDCRTSAPVAAKSQERRANQKNIKKGSSGASEQRAGALVSDARTRQYAERINRTSPFVATA